MWVQPAEQPSSHYRPEESQTGRGLAKGWGKWDWRRAPWGGGWGGRMVPRGCPKSCFGYIRSAAPGRPDYTPLGRSAGKTAMRPVPRTQKNAPKMPEPPHGHQAGGRGRLRCPRGCPKSYLGYRRFATPNRSLHTSLGRSGGKTAMRPVPAPRGRGAGARDVLQPTQTNRFCDNELGRLFWLQARS